MANNLTREERSDFVISYFGRKFTSDEVVLFLKERIELDEKRIIEAAWKAKARQLVNSFKDVDGVRKIAAFDDSLPGHPRKMVYQAIETCYDPDILDRQIQNMLRNRNGFDNLINKVIERKNELEGQGDLLDYLVGLENESEGAEQA